MLKLLVGSLRVEVEDWITLTTGSTASELIYAVSGSISGDAHGLAALVLSRDAACGLCDLMLERPPKTTQAITQEEEDVLLELGNVVVGNYLRVFAQAIPGKNFVHRKARLFSGNSFKLTCLLYDALPGGRSLNSLLFEVAFHFRQSDIAGCIIVAMEAERLRTLFETAEAAEAVAANL